MSLDWTESLKQTLRIMVLSKLNFSNVSKCANLKKKKYFAVFMSCSTELKPIVIEVDTEYFRLHTAVSSAQDV